MSERIPENANMPATNHRPCNERVIYFADPMLTFGCKSIEEEYRDGVGLRLKTHCIKFHDVHCTTEPPFASGNSGIEHFDILFFDWGGMGTLDQRLMMNYCRMLLKDAQEHPSRFYVVASAFTELAMKDAMSEFRDSVPANVFLSIKDFVNYYKVFKKVQSDGKGSIARLHMNYTNSSKKLHIVK